MTIWRMRSAFSIHLSAYKYTDCAIPLQQWLYERYSILRYTYIALRVITKKECVYYMVWTEFLNVIYVKFTYEISSSFESYLL